VNKTLKFQLDGIPFAVKIVKKGERYGLGGCLVHDQEDELVEFYDGRYAGKTGFDPEGQFICRYYVTTLLTREWFNGLLLDTGESSSEWRLTGDEMSIVDTWLRRYLMKPFCK
jgi:hypothetical protein